LPDLLLSWQNPLIVRVVQEGLDLACGGQMLEHIEKLIELDDIGEIWQLHCARMIEFGFDRLIYGMSRFMSGGTTIRDIEDSLILHNHEKAYIDEFFGKRMYGDAPMVRWSMENVGYCSWRWVADQLAAGKLSAAEMKVLEFNQRHDVLAGMSFSFADTSSRARGGIGLCARRGLTHDDVDAIYAKHGREISVLNALMHLKISSMPFATSRRPLTTRQREVLEWVADGKTTADIALILGLTQATVEKHLRLAREALDVETTAQAVLKASVQRQIFLNQSNSSGKSRNLSNGSGNPYWSKPLT